MAMCHFCRSKYAIKGGQAQVKKGMNIAQPKGSSPHEQARSKELQQRQRTRQTVSILFIPNQGPTEGLYKRTKSLRMN